MPRPLERTRALGIGLGSARGYFCPTLTPTAVACRARLPLVRVGRKLPVKAREKTISKIQDVGEVTEIGSTIMFLVYLYSSKS